MATTHEVMVVRQDELRGLIAQDQAEINEALTSGKAWTQVRALEDHIKQLINEDTSIRCNLKMDECAEHDDPMVYAVTELTYQAMRGKIVQDKESGAASYEIEDTTKQIDLTKLNKRVNGGIGHDSRWIGMVEQLNMRLCIKKAQDLGIKDIKEINDSFAMSKLAREIDLGKTPCSNTQMLKTLTTVVQAMIGDQYKPDSHDVAFLKSVYTKHGKRALTVACSSNKQVISYLAEICHRCITGEVYSLEYKKAREKAKKG